MRESGQIDNLISKWLQRSTAGNCNSLETEPLGIDRLVSPFVLMLAAVILSITAWIFETIYFRYKVKTAEIIY